MATRPGDLDPSVVLRLLERFGGDAQHLTDFLYRECGLGGVSGESSDMRVLLGRPGDPAAREAVELFVYQLVKHAGALVAVLGGLDTLAFTGGIGENQPVIRSCVCGRLRYAGCRIDERANACNESLISLEKSAVAVRVVATDENAVIAAHAVRTAFPRNSNQGAKVRA
jgi:acetate kinase